MKRLAIFLLLSAVPMAAHAQTVSAINGVSVCNLSAINGVPIANVHSWNGIPLASCSAAPILDGVGCTSSSVGGSSESCTASVPTAGDAIVVFVTARNSGSFTVTDSNSNTYTSIFSASDPTNPAFAGMQYAKNSASGSITVTTSIPTGGGVVSLFVQPIKGASTTSPLDSTFSSGFNQASTAGTVANANCGSARTPSAANEIIFSFAVFDNVTPTPGSGFTFANTANFLWTQYWRQSAATSTNGAFVSGADDWIAGCAAFHS